MTPAGNIISYYSYVKNICYTSEMVVYPFLRRPVIIACYMKHAVSADTICMPRRFYGFFRAVRAAARNHGFFINSRYTDAFFIYFFVLFTCQSRALCGSAAKKNVVNICALKAKILFEGCPVYFPVAMHRGY